MVRRLREAGLPPGLPLLPLSKRGAVSVSGVPEGLATGHHANVLLGAQQMGLSIDHDVLKLIASAVECGKPTEFHHIAGLHIRGREDHRVFVAAPLAFSVLEVDLLVRTGSDCFDDSP